MCWPLADKKTAHTVRGNFSACAVDFYTILAVQALSELGRTTTAKDDRELHTFRRATAILAGDAAWAVRELSQRWSRGMRDYLLMASAGEARHLPSHWQWGHAAPQSRHECYLKARKYDPNELGPNLVRVFSDYSWPGGFGGKLWAHCAEHAVAWTPEAGVAWVDHAVDLKHNGGPVWNKPVLWEFSNSTLMAWLNFKRYAPNLIESLIGLVADHAAPQKALLNAGLKCISRTAWALVRRYLALEGAGKYGATLALYHWDKTPDLITVADTVTMPWVNWGKDPAPKAVGQAANTFKAGKKSKMPKGFINAIGGIHQKPMGSVDQKPLCELKGERK